MGYYIDFVFKPEEIQNYETIVERFLKAGAYISDDDEIPPHVAEKCLDLFYVGLSSPITVFKKEARALKGNWADVRLSWGTDTETFDKDLRCMLAMAEQVGARLYDGQEKMFITEETLTDLNEKFIKSTKQINNLFGVCSVGTPPSSDQLD
jgi:hypothetical protein